MEGFGWTIGQQGGIGYPPMVVKYKNKWWQVEDSRNHGGTICYQCSEACGIPYGYKPGGFAQQPKPFGSACYSSLIPRPKTRPAFLPKRIMLWEDFVKIIKELYGEPAIIA